MTPSTSPPPNPAAAQAVTDDETVRTALAKALVFDGHNDLAWECRAEAAYSTDGLGADAPHGRFHTDVPRLRRGGVGAQFWSVFVPTRIKGADAVTATLEQIDFVHRLVADYPDDFRLARTGDDVRAAWAEGRIASLLGAEGGHCIDDSLAVLRNYARLGVAYMTLTHNDNTAWADSATDEPVHGGLTDVGREVVREMNRLGMLVDLSHVSPATMEDALDVTSAPVVFSHSSCRAVSDHPRNVPDDVLYRVRKNGGVVMIAFVPSFLNEEWARWRQGGNVGPEPVVSVDDVVAHVEHARVVMGVEHVGLGGDYDGFVSFPRGLEDVATYPRILEALAARGWTADELSALAGGNVLRVLDAAWAARVSDAG
ncbi:dipeptidase [Mumia sp. Pv 4-285]|uniref:dipeptidase n=1 Tax=Mumia qirimensis TaxID=3234852 RepID=UPI00351D600F